MSTGAPEPAIFSDGRYLICACNVGYLVQGPPDMVAVVRFGGLLDFTFGQPEHESIFMHPLYEFGLKIYAFQVIENSPRLAAYLRTYSNEYTAESPGPYAAYRHWVVPFHDQTLEVVAKAALVLGTTNLSPRDAVREFAAREANP
jgi:hypothetical protein